MAWVSFKSAAAINMFTPLTQQSQNGLTMLSRHNGGIYRTWLYGLPDCPRQVDPLIRQSIFMMKLPSWAGNIFFGLQVSLSLFFSSSFSPPSLSCFSVLQNGFVFSSHKDISQQMSIEWSFCGEFYQQLKECAFVIGCWLAGQPMRKLLLTWWRETIKLFLSCCF